MQPVPNTAVRSPHGFGLVRLHLLTGRDTAKSIPLRKDSELIKNSLAAVANRLEGKQRLIRGNMKSCADQIISHMQHFLCIAI